MVARYGGHAQVAAAVSEAGDALGCNLHSVIADKDSLDKTENTQPALLAVCVGVFRAAQLPRAAMFAGHSLGEYAALVCGGAIEFADAVRLARRRGELMQQAAGGKMAAVLANATLVEECCAKTREDGGEVWAANYNSPMQTVVAGRADSADAVCEMLSARGAKKIIPLPVSVPSHCPLMQPAADALLPLLESIPWRAPSPPVLHNAILDVAAPADIPAALAAQLVRPVRWTETIAAMAKADIAQAYECGPGATLTGLARRIPDAPPHAALARSEDLDGLQNN